jgi:nicotinamidase-related amidase
LLRASGGLFVLFGAGFAVEGARPTRRRLHGMTRALVIVDIQNDYFPGGAHPLHEPASAAANAAALLARFREAGDPVFHVQHVAAEPDSPFMREGSHGVEIHESVAPADGEPVVQKEHPNSFRETSLADDLRARGVDEVVVCGMMTAMCVDATVRAADDLGFTVTVAHDACATSDLTFGGESVAAPTVHAAFLAALADGYATVTPAAEIP